jgi:hypothetical protein
MLGAALVVLVMVVAVTRVRAVQEWYHSITVQGRVTMWLLDDHARVDGLLLDEGSQIRVSPRLAEAMLSHARVGDTVSVVGRGGRRSSFGRVVHARTLTTNGQTLIAFDEPHHGPRYGPLVPGGAHRPGRSEEPFPPRPPGDGGRGHIPPPPPGSADDDSVAPPSRRDPVDAPPQPPASGAAADPGTANPPNPPATAPAPGSPDAPPPPIANAHRITARGQVRAFLVGERGEVVGLVLDTGEQVHVAPRVGEGLASGSTAPHTDVVLEGDAVQSERGTVVRARQITVGAKTWIVQ